MHKAECEKGAGLLQDRLNPASMDLGVRLGLGRKLQGTWAGLAGLENGGQKALSPQMPAAGKSLAGKAGSC